MYIIIYNINSFTGARKRPLSTGPGEKSPKNEIIVEIKYISAGLSTSMFGIEKVMSVLSI
jgi:hypothetical protein